MCPYSNQLQMAEVAEASPWAALLLSRTRATKDNAQVTESPASAGHRSLKDESSGLHQAELDEKLGQAAIPLPAEGLSLRQPGRRGLGRAPLWS